MKDCPVVGCDTRIHETLLVCTPHWRLIPYRLRARVKAAFAGGRGVDTERYRDAVDEAIESVDRKAIAA